MTVEDRAASADAGRRRLLSVNDSGGSTGGGERRASEDEAGVVRICGVRTLPSHRQLGLAAVILASTAYFAMEMSTVTTSTDATLQRAGSAVLRQRAEGTSVVVVGSGGVVTSSAEAEGDVKTEEVVVEEDSEYGSTGFPWAVKGGMGKKAFLDQLASAAEVVKSERDALWALHEPVAQHLFPTVHFLSEKQLSARMARALLAQDAFTVGVMGTSVTAGHDNFFNQSYPVVWGNLMTKSFESAGVKLVMRNHAMGWNPINPSYYCVGEVVGEDVDVSVWEFAMMGGDDGDAETWMRMALMLPNQPHLLFLDPGLGARDTADGPREGSPNPWESNPMKWYAEAGFSVASQVMEHAYWKTDHLPNYNAFSMIPKDKPTERPAGWHPGPHGHELRAQILAWNYLRVLADAIRDVSAAVSSGGDVGVLLPKALPLPEPHQCQPALCKERPQCTTTFEPRVGPSMLDHVSFPAKDAIPFVTDDGVAGSNSQEGWHVQLYFCDVGSVGYMLGKGFNYLDRKFILQGSNKDGPVRMEWEQKAENHLIVCSAPGNSHLCKSAKWKVDGAEVKCLDEDSARSAGKPVVHEPCFITESTFAPGKHTIEIEMGEPWQDHDNFIPLSHLITY